MLFAVAVDVLAVVTGEPSWAIFSLLPWLAALLLWRVRSRPFTARFTESGLEVEETGEQVPYASLQTLLAPRRPANPYKAGPPAYLIQVLHEDGVLCIPARLNVPSDDVFSFLFRQLPASGSRDVPKTLVDFLRHKEREYGPERVWTFRARMHLGRVKQYPGGSAFFAALALAGAAWLVWGIIHGPEGWIAGGFFGLLFGILFSLVLWIAGRQNLGVGRGWRQSGLVIAPDGLALAQGDMIGQLSWDEVREVSIGKAPQAFQVTYSNQRITGILLKVEGAVIVIADIFDRPVGLIYQHICYYWRGQPDEERVREAPRLGASDASVPRRSQGISPRE